MIENIIQLLSTSDFYGESEIIEIAKGKNKLPKTLKEKREQTKRAKAWQLRNK